MDTTNDLDPRAAEGAVPAGGDAERLAALEARLAERDAELDGLRRDRAIDEALLAHAVLDLEAGRLLARHALDAMAEPDAGAAVADLARTRPHLFRAAPGARVSGVRVSGDDATADLVAPAAEAAAASGRRQDLLHYLRLRRRR